jgi:ABC-type transport system substrate-binding protein
MPVSRPYNPNGKRVAEMIGADLAKIGIRLKLVTAEWDQYRTRLQAGEAPMALYGWTGTMATLTTSSMCSWAAPQRALAATTSPSGATLITTGW